MKKKGFTLIELLAVIVILAIIALIATPMIMGVIEKARKGAAIQSVNGLLEAGEQYQMEMMFDGNTTNNIDLTSDTLNIKGSKPKSGTLLIDSLGNMSIIAEYGNYCIQKKFLEEEPQIVEKEKCEIDEEEKENITTKIYGIKRALNTSETGWERTDDAEGLTATAIKSQEDLKNGVENNFDSIYPWSGIKSYNYDTETKKITAWIGDEGFQFNGSNGEVLTYIPEFYYKRYQDEENEYIYISNKNLEGYTKSEAFSIGRYTMSLGEDDNKVHSKSGAQPLVNKTIAEFRDYAKQLGDNFSQLDYHYFIIQLLYLVEYADYNSQTKLGLGYMDKNNTTSIKSGECDSLKMKSGTLIDDGHHSMIYRGMEDIYGNIWQFVDGINIQEYQAYVCYDSSKYVSDIYDGCYQKLGYVNETTTGYIQKLGYDKNNSLIGLPIEVEATGTTYISDYYWQNSGQYIMLIGGGRTDIDRAGLWCLGLQDPSSNQSDLISARLIKYK